MTKFAAIGTDGTRMVVWGLGDTEEAALVDAGLQEGVDGVDLTTRPVSATQAEEIERGGVDWGAIKALPTDVTDEQIAKFEAAAGEAGDLEQAAICRAALAGDAGARAKCERAMADADAQNDEPAYEASLTAALEWARAATAGDYLVEYEDTGMTDREDPGSRCGYDDQQLDEIGRLLRERDLRLTADDCGLVAQARDPE